MINRIIGRLCFWFALAMAGVWVWVVILGFVIIPLHKATGWIMGVAS